MVPDWTALINAGKGEMADSGAEKMPPHIQPVIKEKVMITERGIDPKKEN